MPQRIQRSRKKGSKLPPGCVYVGRPTVFGNPYLAKEHGVELALALYRETAQGCWNPRLVDALDDAQVSVIYAAHRAWLARIGHHPLMRIRDLRGKDLACWCALDAPCHADVLLELANR